MRLTNDPFQLVATGLLLIVCLGSAPAQTPFGRLAPAQQPAAPAAQTFRVGEAVEIQAADGSWVAGTVRSIDPATGKFEVVLVNGMSGFAPGSALRRASAANPQAAPQAMPMQMPAQAMPMPAQAQAMPAAAPAPAPVCGGQAMCMEVRNLAAMVTDFRLSTVGASKIIDATVQFMNKTAAPLSVGYVSGSGVVIDDQGNRYNINEGTIRGIGLLRGNTPDPKFVLQPGDTGDALFQFGFVHYQQILGSSFELDLTVREMNPVGVNQYTVGAEYPLRFMGAGETVMSGAPMTSQAAPAAPAAQMAPMPQQAQTAMPFAAPGTPAAAPAAQAAPAAAPAPGRGRFAGLSQAAGGMIPGFRGAAGASGSTGGGAMSQVAQAGSAFAANKAQAAPAPGQAAPAPGQAASTASGLAGIIPGFGGGAGSTTASTAASTAATLIPGFSAPAAAAAPAPGAAPAFVMPGTATAAPAVAGAPVDPCAGQQHCFNAGPFAAQVNQIVGIPGAMGYILRAQVVVRNTSAQALTLGYVAGSVNATDNLGNRFGPSMNGAVEASVGGMGTVGTPQAAAFVLNPGQARNFSVAVLRPATVKTPVGTAFNLNIQVSEMAVNAGQVAPLRAHPMSFTGVACQSCAAVPAPAAAGAPAASGNAAANALRNALKK
jgi:hypothetical protein